MDLIVVGMNHLTAPVEVREKVAFSDEQAKRVLTLIKSEGVLYESMILSTCNRTEVYGIASPEKSPEDYIRNLINKVKQVDYFSIQDYYYVYSGKDAVAHLFRVISGLDSMVVGETQIIGQVKNAYTISCKAKTNDIFINKLLHNAFRVSKRVRNETSIGEGAVSVSLAACELAQKIFTELGNRKALLIGAGETGELAARHLVEKGINSLFITNRTFEKAEEIAEKTGGKAVRFEKYIDTMKEVDIIISSTSSEKTLVDYDTMKHAMDARGNKPLFIIDIAVPRDFPQEIGEIENVFLHDIDDLVVIMEKNIRKRESEVPKTEKIIGVEVDNFIEWYNSLEAAPTIKLLLEKFEDIRKSELEHHRKKFVKKDWDELEMFTRHFIKTLLHNPIEKLKEDNDNNYSRFHILEIIREIFDLDKKDASK